MSEAPTNSNGLRPTRVKLRAWPVPAHGSVGLAAVWEQCISPFGVIAIAALVAWYRRHASESPAAVVLYACALLNTAQAVRQLAMFSSSKAQGMAVPAQGPIGAAAV